jgi:hypothetical protein
MRISTRQEGWFAISAAVAAGALSFYNERAAMALAVIALIVLALYEFAKRRDRGTGAATKARTDQKEENKRAVMSMFNGRPEISNNDVEELLGISDATATNYLQELEDEGKIEQLGITGRHVRYKRVNG